MDDGWALAPIEGEVCSGDKAQAGIDMVPVGIWVSVPDAAKLQYDGWVMVGWSVVNDSSVLNEVIGTLEGDSINGFNLGSGVV